MRDSRWNTTALLLLRISQFLLGVIVLGISAYFISIYEEWFISFTLVVSILTLVWVTVVLSLFFTSKLLPLVVIVVDVILSVFCIVSMATIAGGHPDQIGSACLVYPPAVTSPDKFVSLHCSTLNGGFGILIIEMLTFLGAIIWDGIVLYQNRNRRPRDARVVAQNAPHVFDAGGDQMGGIRGRNYAMPKPTTDTANGGGTASGNQGAQTIPPQYQPASSLFYQAQNASPTTPYNPNMPEPLAPRVPQRDVMMQHRQHQDYQQQQQQVYQVHQIQQQQHRYQRQPQHQYQQYGQDWGPPPREPRGVY
ncbi:hypothetical protein C7212DRAFT_216785 [Tuber magnatum]|uniref:MARVEL domain-containing protein n=1 Tax=Tuber magnatum TaxID=42249 RepID=A0A317SJJ2_9PEZI|nr:hypothetical protein C7212DRAFT_216785 [Tuber magnatum]